MDGKLPVHVPNLGSDNVAEYPFESMIQARVIHRRENTLGMSPSVTSPATSTTSANTTPFVQPAPPPPYPAAAAVANSCTANAKGVVGSPTSTGNNNGSNNIAISSPLLVNLLQNEGAGPSNGSGMAKQQSQDRVNSSSISSGNGGNKCTVQANSNNSKGLMSKSTLVTSQQQQMIQQQVAGTHDKQAIVINNNLLSSKSPNSGSNELVAAAAAATTSTTTPLMQQQAPLSSLGAQSSPVPLPTNANMNNAGQLRRQMSSNVSLPMQQQQRAQHSVYFARTPQNQQSQQQQFKYVVPNALRQQLPPPAQQTAVVPNASYPNASGGNVNVRWKQMDPGCQEFDQYQKQYNHSQQQQENTQVIGPGAGGGDLPPSYGQQYQQQQPTNRSSSHQQHPDPLGLGNLADLADLSKNDLDSLLPSIHPHDLDSALLAFDTKGSSLDSLLDIDLISSLDSANSNNTHATTSTTASGNSSVVTINHSQQLQQLTNGPIIESNHSTSSPQVQLKHTNVNKVTTTNDVPQRFLINPLTGDMEITQVEDTSEQDANNVALVGADFHETYKSDEDDDDESSRGTNFSAKFLTSDMSDTEKSNQSGEHLLLQMSSMKGTTKKGGRTKKEKILNADGTVVKVVKEKAQKTRVSKVKKAVITPVPSPTGGANAELKLRLKLDTGNQPSLKKPIASKPTAMVAQQYNFNASIAQQFMQQSQITSGNASTIGGMNASMMNSVGDQQSPSTEEPRVPPLHISIKNKSVVIKSSASSGHKKEKKRFLSVSKVRLCMKTVVNPYLGPSSVFLTVKGMLMRG